MAIAGAIAAGGAAAVMLFTSGIANAASPSTSAQPAATATAVASQPTTSAGMPANPFLHTETVSDASVVAKAIGITEANLSLLKSGKVKGVRFSTLEKICTTLQCQPGDLLEFRPAMP